MYQITILLSFLILLFGSHQANAAAAKNAVHEYTADALAARAIVKEAMAGFRPILDAFNDPKDATVDQLKTTAEQTLKLVKSHFVPLELVDKDELPDNKKIIYKKAEDIKKEYENALSLMLDIVIGDVQARISNDAKAIEESKKLVGGSSTQLDSIKTKINEVEAKLVALHNELIQLQNTGATGTCLRSSNQVRMYRLHHDALIAAEVLALLSAEFSLTFINKNNDQAIESLIGTIESSCMDRITSTSIAIGPTITTLARELEVCKTPNELGVTYTTLDPIFTFYLASTFGIYIMDNVTLDYNEDKFWFTDKCLPFQKERRCKGKLLGCSPNSLASVYVCPASQDKSHRYNYMRDEDSKVWYPKVAKNTKCPNEEVFLENNIGSVSPQCHYLRCTCEDPADDIIRHFSLKEVLSDDKKVVTGVRFKMQKYTIHLQIQQGTILKNGAIDQSSVEWKDVDDFSPLDSTAEEYRDFITIRSDQRTICMGQLDASQIPPTRLGHVLTGVRFTVQNTDANEKFIRFEIRLTPYDLVTGQLNPEKSTWLFREEKMMHELPDGSKFVSPMETINHINQNCVSFTRTLVDDIHMGQSVVPRISLREVAPHPAVPLAGVNFDFDLNKDLPEGGSLLIDKVFTFSIRNYYNKIPAQS